MRPGTAAVLVLVAGLATPHPVRAQLLNCPAISSDPATYKVVVDELRPAAGTAAADPTVTALKERLEFNLTGQLNALRADGQRLAARLHVPLGSIRCAGRQPSFTGSEFTDDIAAVLSDERVVVEMWGTLEPPAAGAAVPRARVGYLIPPVRHYLSADAAPGFLVIAYPRALRSAAAGDLESLRELSAFALIGLATKAARAQNYDLAVWAFSRAEASVQEARLESADQALDELLAYAELAACETRGRAQADPAYHGPLTLVPPTSCTRTP